MMVERGRIYKKRGLFWCVESLSPAGEGYLCEGGKEKEEKDWLG